jgi:HlyD family secretion protein
MEYQTPDDHWRHIGLSPINFRQFLFRPGRKSKLNVDLDRITISEIKQDKFQESIPQNGTVLPLTTIYLNTPDGGRVAERYVEDGAMLKKGDPILKLVNTDVEYNMANTANQVSSTLANIELGRINADQNTVTKLTTTADVELAFKEAERIYLLDDKLYAAARHRLPGIHHRSQQL